MTVLAIYQWHEFWSMGEGRGAPSFFLSVTSFPKHGHEMHVLMPGRRDLPRSENYHGISIHRFPTGVRFTPEPGRSRILQHAKILAFYLYWFVRAMPAAAATAGRVRPDVVVGMGPLSAPVARFVARRRRVPNVTRLFGTELDQVAGSPLRYWLRYWQIAGLRTPASYVVMHNDGSGGDRAAQKLGVDMDRFMFWPDGVDKEMFGPHRRDLSALRTQGVPEGNRVVLSVSRLHPEKHVERLLEAAPAVLREMGGVTFLIVGDGGERAFLETTADSLGVSDSVVFAGSLPRDALPALYASSDVFVTLSDRTNAFNPLYEAMISGLPVVALNTGRTADFIDDGHSGVLVEPGEIERLPSVLIDLLSDAARLEALGAAAREQADRRFPTIEERQAMEVDVVERAVAERGDSGQG